LTDQFDDDQTKSFVVLTKGMTVSHYRIIEKIGAGGMGEVYLAEDTKLHRKAALKFLSADLCREPAYRSQLTREAQAVARLSHPNIVTVYEVGEYQGRPWYSMAHIEGQTLCQLRSGRILSMSTVVDLGIQIATALSAAHEHSVTHRDLKPANIIVDASETVHVLDFGLALITENKGMENIEATVTRLDAMSAVAGTLPYMAPEQLSGGHAGPRSDIYSLGVILYELASGQRPFQARSATELATCILRDEPQPLSLLRRDTPYDLSRIVARCLRKDPERRFQNVRDVRNELLDLRDLIDQDEARIEIDSPAAAGKPILVEAGFRLTADLVRRLDYKSPQMIGDQVSYLDNGVKSDRLAIFMHGLGMDQRQYADLLRMFPYRGIAPSLYGFELRASRRFPLSIDDHSILLRALLRHIKDQLQPKRVILCGHSTGADHILQLIGSTDGAGIEVDSVLSFGCNTNLESCVLSSKLARLASNREDEIIEAIREFGHTVGSLRDYLTVCEYMVTGFQKFQSDIECLKQFAIGIVTPFDVRGWDQFPLWYRATTRRVRHPRFIFSRYEFDALDRILRHHLESNVLGDDFREDTIVRENVSHLDLSDPELMLRHAAEAIEAIA
jgi:pimeloyl-ACP methyl ester carboxylesterase